MPQVAEMLSLTSYLVKDLLVVNRLVPIFKNLELFMKTQQLHLTSPKKNGTKLFNKIWKSSTRKKSKLFTIRSRRTRPFSRSKKSRLKLEGPLWVKRNWKIENFSETLVWKLVMCTILTRTPKNKSKLSSKAEPKLSQPNFKRSTVKASTRGNFAWEKKQKTEHKPSSYSLMKTELRKKNNKWKKLSSEKLWTETLRKKETSVTESRKCNKKHKTLGTKMSFHISIQTKSINRSNSEGKTNILLILFKLSSTLEIRLKVLNKR